MLTRPSSDDGAGYLIPGDWVSIWDGRHPIAVVHQFVAFHSMDDPDQIKAGWSVAGLWCLWFLFFGISLVISILFARVFLKSDRWLGYAALICAAIVTFVLVESGHFSSWKPIRDIYAIYCLGLLGLRGVFAGILSNRICAGLALVVFGWFLFSYFAPLIKNLWT